MDDNRNFELEFKEDVATEIATSPKNSQKQIVMSFDLFMCLLVVLFKVLAILAYFIVMMFGSLELLTFVLVVVLTSVDFWATKNLCGRKLVGLRWWSQFNQEDEEEWIFESCEPNRVLNEANSNIFWAAQFIIVTFWAAMLLMNMVLLRMFWFCLDVFSFLLTAINMYCFFKCRGEHQKKIHEFAEKVGLRFMSQGSL